MKAGSSRFLEFIQRTVSLLLEKQSARPGGRPDAPLFLTVTKGGTRRWRSIGPRPEGGFHQELVEAQPLELQPFRADLRSWPFLKKLSVVTGEPRYARMAEAMATAFAEYGFDQRCGLAYLGVTAEFDVLALKPRGVQHYDTPSFKPSGVDVIEPLWAVAPEKTARMIKAAYYGLITRPATMDFNRYCYFDFDDAGRKPALKFNSMHRAFASTGATLIGFWAFLFARTLDQECLQWAGAMAEKWQAVQHAETGLMPHFFGADTETLDTMPPKPISNVSDGNTALILLDAARELRRHPAGRALGDQVADMGRRLLLGLARHGYDPGTRRFHEWMWLDGRPYTEVAYYAFPTQEQKDAAVKQQPVLADVPVFSGRGFYTGDPFKLVMSNDLPRAIAEGAVRTGDPELRRSAIEYAGEVMAAARQLPGPVNAKGQWSYVESGSHIQLMLALCALTGAHRYLAWAEELADMELRFLAQPAPDGVADWWRLNPRCGFLQTLAELEAARSAWRPQLADNAGVT